MTGAENITISLSEYNQYLEENTSLKSEIELLKYQLAELKRLVFGTKSERHITPDPNQLSLFDMGEAEDCDNKKQEEEITYKRKKPGTKKQPLRLPIPAHLLRKTEVIEPENLPENAKKIGEDITETLEITPANIWVRQIRRPKYIIEQNDEKTEIVIAELPSLPIPKGNAGASLLAYILICKFFDHLPFYRQSQIFKRYGVHIPESTINGWFNASCQLLWPLYEELKKVLLSGDYLQADETPIPVLTKDKPGATHTGYHWVYHDPVRRLVLFDYQKTRGREGPDNLLKNFKGWLQTDAYAAYNKLKNALNIIQLACMAHARRKFEHALDYNPALANEMLDMIRALYDIEREAKDMNLSYDAIKELRQEKSIPVLQEMEDWLNTHINDTLPKSPIGMAIAYMRSIWPRLKRYCDDGRFCIDNNLIENCIRPIALGRKNYLFAGSHEGAKNAAMMYSLLAMCKINNVDPFVWLTQTLSVIQDTKVSQLHTLLPGQK